MAARRSNKRKRRNRRGGPLYLLISATLILVVVVSGCAIFFRANRISVTGVTRYTHEEVIQISGVELGDNLFLLPRMRIGRDICAQLPYVDEVSVVQELPDGVELRIIECVPMAVVLGDGQWWVMDAKGKLLESIPQGTQPHLPVVRGVTALEPVAGGVLKVEEGLEIHLEGLLQLSQALVARDMIGDVTHIDLNQMGEIHFIYQERFTVEVPLRADFDWKLRTLEEVVDKLQINETGVIDITRDDKVYFDPMADE